MSPAANVADLKKEEWFSFFDELRSLKVKQVTLLGGEPFVRSDILDIINELVQKNISFVILSNGSLITNEIGQYISETGYCNHFQISLDGSDDRTHDIFRGKGSFKSTISGIKILKKYGIKLNLNVTIHRKNFNKLQEIAEFIFQSLDLPGFTTNSANFLGKCRYSSPDVQMTLHEYQEAMENHVHLFKTYEGRISASSGPLADAIFWVKMINAKQNNKDPFPGCGFLSGCSTPLRDISVLADGTIVPCLQLSHIALGNIKNNQLSDIWSNNTELNNLRQRNKIPLSNFEMCSECEYTNYCTGNCPAIAYSETGRINHPSPSGCLHLFLKNGGSIPKIAFDLA